jgi:hypothetical protein
MIGAQIVSLLAIEEEYYWRFECGESGTQRMSDIVEMVTEYENELLEGMYSKSHIVGMFQSGRFHCCDDEVMVGVLIPTPFVLLFIQSNVQRKTDYISDTGKPRIPRKDIV